MMNIIYQTAEIMATVIEAIVFSYASVSMAGKKYTGKKHLAIFLCGVLTYTVVITLMNKWEAFSFLTIFVSALIIFIFVLLMSSGNLLQKITSVVVTMFFVHALDYLLAYSLTMIFGKSLDISKGLALIINPGPTRLLFLIILKILQLLIFFSCRKLYSKFQNLDNKSVGFLLVITLLSYVVMSEITQLMLTDSILTIQLSSMFALFFIILTIIGTLFSTIVNAKYQNEKRESQLMELTNELMEKNYETMRNSQNIIRQQVHDFKNHLRAVNGMLEEDSPAKEYVENLLAESYNSAQFCRSGNDVIDSIINCKVNEAYEKHIDFKYNVMLSTKLNISSVDICAVLANQIDNALEAALKVAQLKERFVKVEITQKEAFVFFKVENSCSENPFNSKNELKTTKDNSNGMHGLGIKNIKETAEKYSGELKNEYNEGVFTSIAMLMNND